MREYKKLRLRKNEENINQLYKELLDKKYPFLLLKWENKKYILTKEKSLIEIKNEKKFLENIRKDIYYKTIIKEENKNEIGKDLNIYKTYLNKYKDKIVKKRYNHKYYFGCIAVKLKKGFITTIRGKDNLEEYTIVEKVNHKKYRIEVSNKKASLNAPLLDYLFKNKKVKTIVHLHEFDNSLPYYDYAFPGTVKDTIRNNTTSFNIKHHGVIYLYDEKGNKL